MAIVLARRVLHRRRRDAMRFGFAKHPVDEEGELSPRGAEEMAADDDGNQDGHGGATATRTMEEHSEAAASKVVEMHEI